MTVYFINKDDGKIMSVKNFEEDTESNTFGYKCREMLKELCLGTTAIDAYICEYRSTANGAYVVVFSYISVDEPIIKKEN